MGLIIFAQLWLQKYLHSFSVHLSGLCWIDGQRTPHKAILHHVEASLGGRGGGSGARTEEAAVTLDIKIYI